LEMIKVVGFILMCPKELRLLEKQYIILFPPCFPTSLSPGYF